VSGEYKALLYEHVAIDTAALGGELAEALAFFAAFVRGPVTDEQPPLRDGWYSMRCLRDRRVPVSEADMLTDHECCRCPHCRWQARNAAIVSNWRLSCERRPHRTYSHPFGSVGAALASTHRPDGVPMRSSMGSLGARLKEINELEAVIQTTVRHDRDPVEIRRTDLTIDVERCVVQACSREDVRGGVSTGAAIRLVTASAQDGYEPGEHAEPMAISTSAVRGVVSRARKRVTVELAARGLIPEPRSRVKLDAEISKRRLELVG